MNHFVVISKEFKKKVMEIYPEPREPKKKVYDEQWIGFFTFQQNNSLKNEIKKK